jgi:hypothetical protein
MSGAYSAGKDSTILERTAVPVDTGRVSGVKEAVLGTALMGRRIFLCSGRGSNTRDDTGVYQESA